MSNHYTVDYFIEKFSKIPDEQWTTGNYAMDGKCCALGHCGRRHGFRHEPPDATALDVLFSSSPVSDESLISPTAVNDGLDERFRQPTPKARILAALNCIKERQVK